MIGPEHERARPPGGTGFGDSVSFSFADREARLYGLARVGLVAAEGRASSLAVLFSGQEPVAASVMGGIEIPEAAWADLAVGEVRASVEEPLQRWRVSFEAEQGSFDLSFSAASPPLEEGTHTPVGAVSGMEGYEQVCEVHGEVRHGGSRRTLRCLGQRGHGWGPSPWERIALARTVSAWFEGPRGVTLGAVRPEGAAEHGDEALTAFLVEPGDEGVAHATVAEPRLSTTYDAERRQRRAGIELWMDVDDELPRRVAGEVACGTTLELGRLRLDCSFFHWRMEGREGAGRYDVLRRA